MTGLARPAIVLGLLLAACATPSGDAAPEPQPPAASDQISLTRGPCFGTCPIYSVTVWGDGRVRFVGERFVEDTGERTDTVAVAQVAALFAHADSIRFFDMPSDITPANEAACGGAWTDMPSAEITIVRGARDQTVHHYHGCPKAPPSLAAFEERIDAVLGTAKWVGRR